MEYIDKRRIWSEKAVLILKECWPHWGTEKSSQILQLKPSQVKAKADFLKIKMLPKNLRKCISCDAGFQSERKYALQCRQCHLNKRTEHRKTITKTTEVWMKELLRTLKYRSRERCNEECNLNYTYLYELWVYQNKKCIYTGLELKEPTFYGNGSRYDAASMDRIDSSKGYIMGNVVWCCWGCNIAKLDFQLIDFINRCELISARKTAIYDDIKTIQSLI